MQILEITDPTLSKLTSPLTCPTNPSPPFVKYLGPPTALMLLTHTFSTHSYTNMHPYTLHRWESECNAPQPKAFIPFALSKHSLQTDHHASRSCHHGSDVGDKDYILSIHLYLRRSLPSLETPPKGWKRDDHSTVVSRSSFSGNPSQQISTLNCPLSHSFILPLDWSTSLVDVSFTPPTLIFLSYTL